MAKVSLTSLSSELSPIVKSYLTSLIKDTDTICGVSYKYLVRQGCFSTIKISFVSLLEKHLRNLGYKSTLVINDYSNTDIVVLDKATSMILVRANFNRKYNAINIIK